MVSCLRRSRLLTGLVSSSCAIFTGAEIAKFLLHKQADLEEILIKLRIKVTLESITWTQQLDLTPSYKSTIITLNIHSDRAPSCFMVPFTCFFQMWILQWFATALNQTTLCIKINLDVEKARVRNTFVAMLKPLGSSFCYELTISYMDFKSWFGSYWFHSPCLILMMKLQVKFPSEEPSMHFCGVLGVIFGLILQIFTAYN